MKQKIKPMYALRVRLNDQDNWRDPEYFATQSKRDSAERMMRIVGGFRTHTWHETKEESEVRWAAERLRAHGVEVEG